MPLYHEGLEKVGSWKDETGLVVVDKFSVLKARCKAYRDMNEICQRCVNMLKPPSLEPLVRAPMITVLLLRVWRSGLAVVGPCFSGAIVE